MILKQEVHTHCIVFTDDNTFDRWLIASAKVVQCPSKHDRNLKKHALNLSTYNTLHRSISYISTYIMSFNSTYILKIISI